MSAHHDVPDDAARSPEDLREEVEQELDDLADKASQEEAERMDERDETGVDEPTDS